MNTHQSKQVAGLLALLMVASFTALASNAPLTAAQYDAAVNKIKQERFEVHYKKHKMPPNTGNKTLKPAWETIVVHKSWIVAQTDELKIDLASFRSMGLEKCTQLNYADGFCNYLLLEINESAPLPIKAPMLNSKGELVFIYQNQDGTFVEANFGKNKRITLVPAVYCRINRKQLKIGYFYWAVIDRNQPVVVPSEKHHFFTKDYFIFNNPKVTNAPSYEVKRVSGTSRLDCGDQ